MPGVLTAPQQIAFDEYVDDLEAKLSYVEIGKTQKENPIYQKHKDHADEHIAKLKNGDNVQRIVEVNGKKVLEHILRKSEEYNDTPQFQKSQAQKILSCYGE